MAKLWSHQLYVHWVNFIVGPVRMYSPVGGSLAVHAPKYTVATNMMGTIHWSSCWSVSFNLCADLTRYVNDTLVGQKEIFS